MKHIEGTFTGFGDVKLYYQSWHPDTQVQAVVALVHGLGGHSDLLVRREYRPPLWWRMKGEAMTR
ncbi:MAG: hypothetical protein ACP5RH_13710 [Leptodesmis sp.]|uniref:hypothetical protein n=1 Tax=Leptodesmis sp. TaxID=3100501 RepID=UPI003D0CED43